MIDDLLRDNAVPPQRQAAKQRIEKVVGNLRYQYCRKQLGTAYEPRLPFGIQVSVHKVSLTLAMLPSYTRSSIFSFGI